MKIVYRFEKRCRFWGQTKRGGPPGEYGPPLGWRSTAAPRSMPSATARPTRINGPISTIEFTHLRHVTMRQKTCKKLVSSRMLLPAFKHCHRDHRADLAKASPSTTFVDGASFLLAMVIQKAAPRPTRAPATTSDT